MTNSHPVQHPSPAMSDADVSRALSVVGEVLDPPDTVVMGPFAVFRANSAEAGVRTVSSSTPTPMAEIPCVTVPLKDRELGGADSFGHEQGFHPGALDSTVSPAMLSIVSCVGQLIKLDPSPLSESQWGAVISPYLGLSMPMHRDHNTSMLLDHYLNHVAERLQPVLHPGNPWRNTYFSLAIEGSSELFLCQTSTASSTHASVALFHGLLSAAAFHLRNTTNGHSGFRQLGLKHRVQALRALKLAMASSYDLRLYNVTLTAMLALVTIDVSVSTLSLLQLRLMNWACRLLPAKTATFLCISKVAASCASRTLRTSS